MAKRTIPHHNQISLPFADNEKFCLQCGMVYRKTATNSKRYWAVKKFCSKRCGVIWYSATNIPKMIQARAEKPTWNKGKQFSLEHKAALSRMRKGRPYSETRRQRMIERIREVRGAEWQPNTIHSIKDSLPYKEWRKSVFLRDGFRCVVCGYQSRTRINGRSDIQADHIKPFSLIVQENGLDTREKALECAELWDVSNGRTLCIECHKKTPTYGRNVLYQSAPVISF